MRAGSWQAEFDAAARAKRQELEASVSGRPSRGTLRAGGTDGTMPRADRAGASWRRDGLRRPLARAESAPPSQQLGLASSSRYAQRAAGVGPNERPDATMRGDATIGRFARSRSDATGAEAERSAPRTLAAAAAADEPSASHVARFIDVSAYNRSFVSSTSAVYLGEAARTHGAAHARVLADQLAELVVGLAARGAAAPSPPPPPPPRRSPPTAPPSRHSAAAGGGAAAPALAATMPAGASPAAAPSWSHAAEAFRQERQAKADEKARAVHARTLTPAQRADLERQRQRAAERTRETEAQEAARSEAASQADAARRRRDRAAIARFQGEDVRTADELARELAARWEEDAHRERTARRPRSLAELREATRVAQDRFDAEAQRHARARLGARAELPLGGSLAALAAPAPDVAKAQPRPARSRARAGRRAVKATPRAARVDAPAAAEAGAEPDGPLPLEVNGRPPKPAGDATAAAAPAVALPAAAETFLPLQVAQAPAALAAAEPEPLALSAQTGAPATAAPSSADATGAPAQAE